MKYLLVILILLHVSIFADDLTALYKNRNYQECYKKALNKTSYSDINTELILGRCAKETDHTNMAIAAFERVLFLEPDNIDAMLELTQIYDELKLEKQKNIISNSLNNYQLTPEQRSRLNTLSKEEDFSSFEARVILGAGYDTNLNILPLEGEADSAYVRFNTAFSFVHELDERGGWFLLSDINYLHQSNESEHFYDIDFISVSAGVGYKFLTSSIKIPLYYKRLFYLKEDLVHEFSLQPKLDISISKDFIYSLGVEVAKREFIADEYYDNNFEMIGGSMSTLWLFGADMIYLKGIYKHFISTKSQPTIFTAKDNYFLSAGGTYNFTKKFASKLNYFFRNSDYADTFIQGTKRHDKNHTFNLDAEYKIDKHFKSVLLFKYSSNISNYHPASYHKQLYELYVEYDY